MFPRYSEAVRSLYSGNTFLFFQNHALRDFHDAILPKRFQSIRSVHIQWHCQEWGFGISSESLDGGEVFPGTLSLLRDNPRLDAISIFVEGPLFLKESHEKIITNLAKVQESWVSPSPKLFVLRLPYQSKSQFVSKDELDRMPMKPAPPFQLISYIHALYGVELDVPEDFNYGWRYGVQFLPPDESIGGAENYSMKSYLIWADRLKRRKTRILRINNTG